MGWIERNLRGAKADESSQGPRHTHTWSAWGDTELAWQESRTCACGEEQTRNKH